MRVKIKRNLRIILKLLSRKNSHIRYFFGGGLFPWIQVTCQVSKDTKQRLMHQRIFNKGWGKSYTYFLPTVIDSRAPANGPHSVIRGPKYEELPMYLTTFVDVQSENTYVGATTLAANER